MFCENHQHVGMKAQGQEFVPSHLQIKPVKKPFTDLIFVQEFFGGAQLCFFFKVIVLIILFPRGPNFSDKFGIFFYSKFVAKSDSEMIS